MTEIPIWLLVILSIFATFGFIGTAALIFFARYLLKYSIHKARERKNQ